MAPLPTTENVVFYARDFFGVAVTARLSFWQGDREVHRDQFGEDGYLQVSVPDQLEPGAYDLVATRFNEDGTVAGEYKIESMTVPLATHFFQHAQLHGDMQLTGGNFTASEGKVEPHKFNPILYQRMRRLPGGFLTDVKDVLRDSGNPDSIRWGGRLTLDSGYLKIFPGAAQLDGRMRTWGELTYELPRPPGVYYVGLNAADGEDNDPPRVFDADDDGEPDLVMATFREEGVDWYRLTVSPRYHVLYRNGRFHYFLGYQRTADDATYVRPSQEILAGLLTDGVLGEGSGTPRIWGPSRTSTPVGYVKLRFPKPGTGPVLYTDRVRVWATPEYFLLFEGSALLTALPRYVGDRIALRWGRGDDVGLHFDSWGRDGHTHWATDRVFAEAHVVLMGLMEVEEARTALPKKVLGLFPLATNDVVEWRERYRTTSVTMTWNGREEFGDFPSHTGDARKYFPGGTEFPWGGSSHPDAYPRRYLMPGSGRYPT